MCFCADNQIILIVVAAKIPWYSAEHCLTNSVGGKRLQHQVIRAAFF